MDRLPVDRIPFLLLGTKGSKANLITVAEYSTTMKVHEGGGIEHEQENIEVLEIPIEQAMEMIANGEIKDGKQLCCFNM